MFRNLTGHNIISNFNLGMLLDITRPRLLGRAGSSCSLFCGARTLSQGHSHVSLFLPAVD
jgi:hypothetical protein